MKGALGSTGRCFAHGGGKRCSQAHPPRRAATGGTTDPWLGATMRLCLLTPDFCIYRPVERTPPRAQPVGSISSLESAFPAATAALGSHGRSRLAAAFAVLQLRKGG